jgi:glycosyltransferase involved in cell wall biosynthesis/FMN phosphatase YigB (HAD superfamily)/tetratricopeptide (TPR) repeat protein
MNEPTVGVLWRKDESLCRAADLLDRLGDKVRAVSFDFFDTLVWRLVGRPIDVFTEVGNRLGAQQGLRPGISPADFGTLRRHAEYKARERQNLADSKCEDISLTAIYAQMQAVLENPAAVAEMEHAAECELCLLNPGVVEFIHYLRGRGLRLLIVSDIYFSAEQLRAILVANHLDPALFEKVLTSCDAGLCKGTGNLFKRALKELSLQPEQLMHLGDNYHADVLGARKAGIHACHYPQASADSRTILDREQVLLGGLTPVFSPNSLRMLAARYFPEESSEGFFGRMGALMMGPLMTRYASWACEQYMSAGVRKVGAFMREGDLFAQVLQQEAESKGYPLDIQPLFINRKATDLAALGKLTGPRLLDWLERRCTLKIRGILKHFGLTAEELGKLPFALDEKADTPEKILKLAEYLFIPRIASRIEAKSAEERRMVMDYLRPWLESGGALGLCDIGYSGSALAQLHRILALEQNPTKLVGCYLVTYEKAAMRVLEGMDIRHFLGSFGKPDYYFSAFLRSPAFIEQALVAPLGTTLGYERQPDGSVTPILDKTPFDPEILRKQKAFKDGVLLFQKLWFATEKARPGLLDGESALSRRVLADIDIHSQPILARATALPVTSELAHFGSLPLDDYYFGDAMKPMCTPKDQEALRQHGYVRLLRDLGVHWPQGVHALENPKSNSEFVSYVKTFLSCDSCNPLRDGDGIKVDLTVFVAGVRNPATLSECLSRLRKVSTPALRMEVVVAVPSGHAALQAATREFSNQFTRFRVGEISSRDSVNSFMNGAADDSVAPFVLFIQEDTFLPADWDKLLLAPLHASSDVAAVFPTLQASNGSGSDPTARCLMVRRAAFVEGLGLDEKSTPDDAVQKWIAHLEQLKWKTVHASHSVVELKSPLKKTKSIPAAVPTQTLNVDWVGSFQDYGSLSQVNRASTSALETLGGVVLNRAATKSPQVTVRHQWPPDWSRPAKGPLVIIQPWEFGALPVDWVKAARDVNEFWVPSNYVRQVYIDSGISCDKVKVIPNGIDPSLYSPGVTPLPLATKKKFRFLFVGGTIPRKGPDVLLHAYLEAFTNDDDVCLVIKDFGGNSVYQGQTFEKQIQAAQANPKSPEIVYLNSELPPEDMPRLYAACHCLVHPYRGEGFGMPVLEAMACGLPVVVTRGGAADDFVIDQAGWFIPAQKKSIGRSIGTIPLVAEGWWLEPDLSALVQHLKYIAAHAQEAVARGACGAEVARKNYTWQHVAGMMKARLEEVARASQSSVRQTGKIELPAAALVGHLGGAREALHRKRNREAWDLAAAALQIRPFHPEAWLTMAQAAGANTHGKACLERARHLAPKWKALESAGKLPLRPTIPNWPAPPEIAATPRLTVCLITKNEEAFLEQCLQSICDIASQIVVVDTGSTDRTVEIAKKFKAEVHFLAWNDDFSAARNEALKYATGDWILSLDADEELLPEHRRTLVEEMQSSNVMAYRMPIIDKGREQEGCSYVPRLFRNAPGLFFVGRVHEQIFSSLEVRGKEWGLENRLGRAALLHHGYQPEVVAGRDKVARNLRLLRLALAELPGEPNLVMNLGLELIRSGELEAGLEQYREALRLMSALPTAQIVPELRETLLTQLTTHLLQAKRFSEIVQLWERPFSQAGGMTASQHFLLGLAEIELQQPAAVVEQMRQCLAKRRAPALSPVNKDILKAGPHHCLALSFAALDQETEAEKSFRDALTEEPKSRAVRFDLARYHHQHRRHVESLKLLNDLVAENPADLVAWLLGGQIALSQPEYLEFAQNWTSEAVKHNPTEPALTLQRAEALTLSQQMETALPLWSQIQPAQSARHLAALILCELLTGNEQTKVAPINEKAASQEFLKWYRQLIKYAAHSTVHQINDKLDTLRAILPTASEILATALKRADEAVAA